ncbi:hypothetical protein BDB00DRAFT_878803 [Zychaea mexicana]|uniref:uncharacterized protein n=1 Tax=Zychaea mexicana TaxID=64656 RepID=UPI0022FEF651|nr:uncharacterized protein BDB00DRAFT_878803 [Zychaea mexicana]KAI9484484.1 hypothetical protein BDB00DRAFT_878803 [Zychaea mexicana]
MASEYGQIIWVWGDRNKLRRSFWTPFDIPPATPPTPEPQEHDNTRPQHEEQVGNTSESPTPSKDHPMTKAGQKEQDDQPNDHPTAKKQKTSAHPQQLQAHTSSHQTSMDSGSASPPPYSGGILRSE